MICTLDPSITVQIAVLDCWDWHADVSANVQNSPTEIGEYLDRGNIVTL